MILDGRNENTRLEKYFWQAQDHTLNTLNYDISDATTWRQGLKTYSAVFSKYLERFKNM